MFCALHRSTHVDEEHLVKGMYYRELVCRIEGVTSAYKACCVWSPRKKNYKKTPLHSHNYLSFEVSYCDKILFVLKGRECMRKKKYWVSLDNNDKNDKTGPLDNTSVTATTHVCLK